MSIETNLVITGLTNRIMLQGCTLDRNETNPPLDRRHSHNPFVPRQVEVRTGLLPPQRKEWIDLKPKQVEVGSLKEGTVTSVSKYFIMILLDEDVDTIDLISEQLKGYLMERRSKMNRPKPGFLGACFIDNRWLRARIIGSFEMELVDVGKICTFCDKQGNSLHELFFINHWPEVSQWTELSIKLTVESFTGGARKFLTSYQREQLHEQLVGKPFAIRFIAPINSLPNSVKLFPLQQIDGADLVKHIPVKNIPEAPLSDVMIVDHVGKSKDGVFYGQISGSYPVVAELSKMGGMYKEEKGLGINAVTMERGQYVVWRPKFKNFGRFRRVVITGESDDGFYYEGRFVDTGEVAKLRINESFVMVKPFDKYPAQSIRFILSENAAEPKIGKATSLKMYMESRNDDGVFVVSRYDVLGGEPASAKVPESVELDWDEEGSRKSLVGSDQTVPVGELRPASGASSSDCKLSTILEQQSVESFLAHESEFSQDSLTSIDEEFEPSFYEVDGKRSYPKESNGTESDPNEQLEDFGDEIADLDLQRDVKLVLETILQQVEFQSQVVESDQEGSTLQSMEDTLVDLGLPQAVTEVLVDAGSAPGFAVDLMDLELDESPRSRVNSNLDILTGNDDKENDPDSTGTSNAGTSGDLIDC